MIKSKYLFFLIILSLPLYGMSSLKVSLNNLSSQLNHVNTEINAVKRAWNESRIQIFRLKKTSLELFNKISSIFDKIISSEAFIVSMNNTVNQQYESIVNNNMTFSSVKISNTLSSFYSKPMHLFGQLLYTAMANKIYCEVLGKKLAQKSKELAATIITLRAQVSSDQ